MALELLDWFPQVVGLELTLACPHRCLTCGSSAGMARPDELSSSQWLSVIDELGALGTERITLLGGEPLSHPGWQELAARGIAHGMHMEMVTSGFGLDDATVQRMVELPLTSVTVSVDGTEAVHDRLRRNEGSYRRVLGAIRRLDGAAIPVGVTTQVNTQTMPLLEALGEELEAAGVLAWQIQLTLPTGRALETELVLGPEQMPTLYTTLRRLHEKRALSPHFTDSIGWCTPDDVKLRTPKGMPKRAWIGCQAGIRVLGVASNGRVKGCLSMPDREDDANLRHQPLREIWRDPARFSYNRRFDPASLSGACARCAYGRLCRGGCTAASMAWSGKPNVSRHCLRFIADSEQRLPVTSSA
jgi:radical SAM protein with 4Fe4S-binding SPASM domain